MHNFPLGCGMAGIFRKARRVCRVCKQPYHNRFPSIAVCIDFCPCLTAHPIMAPRSWLCETKCCNLLPAPPHLSLVAPPHAGKLGVK